MTTNHLANERYSRQIRFSPIGEAGQEKLRQSRVAIVGLGALGSVLATQLVRAGVGHIRLMDRDIVDLSNLQRQILYDETDVHEGTPKALAAKKALERVNSDVELESVVTDVTPRNAEDVLRDVDLIMDGTDNYQIRYLINDVAVKHRIPWVYGGAVSSYGSAALIRPHETPCLVCLFGAQPGSAPDTCDTVGVLAPVVSIVASLQVGEAIKYLTGNHSALSNTLVTLDIWNNDWYAMKYRDRDAACPCCGKGQFSWLDAKQDAIAISLCGRNTVQVHPKLSGKLDFSVLMHRLSGIGAVRCSADLLMFRHDGLTISLFPDGRALIQGTDDPSLARTLYAKYIGM